MTRFRVYMAAVGGVWIGCASALRGPAWQDAAMAAAGAWIVYCAWKEAR